ncbi:MAG TPA: biopolymer transporter ExbD [Bdellovibrionales bacterium]|nr:biopolymer transporter ExbD [Bdellovibrionales bacterium]
MARRGLSKYMDRRTPSSFKIQITSLVDMFVILLVFLLKSYSTSPVNITPKDGLLIPESTATVDPVDVVKLVVAQDGVFVEEKKVLDLEKGRVPASVVDANDPSFLRALYEALDERAKLAKSISKVNDSFEFDGKVLMQADRNLPYDVLQKIMYTSMMAGYADVKLAVAQK